MLIITKGSRKDLVRRQKLCIDEVNRHLEDAEKNKEVFEDFEKWSREGGLYSKAPSPKAIEWVTTFDKLQVEKKIHKTAEQP